MSRSDETPKVEVLDEQQGHPADLDRVRQVARAAFHAGGGRGDDLTILLAGDDRLRDLNRRYLDRDRPTDVLSFPSNEDTPEGTVHLGDVALSMDAAARQARAAGCALEEEVDRLVVHGVLHLLGYDHEVDDGEMMALQEGILRDLRGPRRS